MIAGTSFIILTLTPIVPAFNTATCIDLDIKSSAGNPDFLIYPSWNFSVLDRSPEIFPAISISTPKAPARIILLR